MSVPSSILLPLTTNTFVITTSPMKIGRTSSFLLVGWRYSVRQPLKCHRQPLLWFWPPMQSFGAFKTNWRAFWRTYQTMYPPESSLASSKHTESLAITLPNLMNHPITRGLLVCFHFHYSSRSWIILPIYLVLDPRITYEELQVDYADDADLCQGLEKSKAALYEHFNNYYAILPTNLNPSSAVSPSQHLSISESQPPLFDFTARFWHQVQRPSLNELDEYLHLPPQEFHSCDPIQWWYTQRHRFPWLYLLAWDILAIPGLFNFFLCWINLNKQHFVLGSAVAVERIFSGGRDTISLRRASLRPDTIRILMLVKHFIRRRQTRAS